MNPEEIAASFAVHELEDPFASLLRDFVSPEAGAEAIRENEAAQVRYYEILPLVEQLPDRVSSIAVYTTYDVTYSIGLHYRYPGVEWERIAFSYIADYGKPTRVTDSGYLWEDDRTRLTVESSDSIVNVFFTDRALQAELDYRGFRQ